MSEKPPKRLQSQTERDFDGLKARREREAGAPEFVCEDPTGTYGGEELKAERRKREPDKRIEHIEDRLDDHGKKFEALGERLGGVESAVAGLEGQMTIVPELVSTMRDATKAMRDRETVVFTAKVDVAKAQAKAQVEDAADAKKHGRARTTKIVGLASVAAGVAVDLLHRLGVL
jgi:hypothetical protein